MNTEALRNGLTVLTALSFTVEGNEVTCVELGKTVTINPDWINQGIWYIIVKVVREMGLEGYII